MSSLLITILDRKSDATIIPLLSNQMSICVVPIDPICNVAMRVLFDWILDYYDNNTDAVDNGDGIKLGRSRWLLSIYLDPM